MEWEGLPEMGEYEYCGGRGIDETQFVRPGQGRQSSHNYCMYTGPSDPTQLPRTAEETDPRLVPMARRMWDALDAAVREIPELLGGRM